MPATATKTNASQAAREALAPILADLIDLSLQGKQAHWNVKGREFKPVHEQLDEIVNQARLHYDDVAERIVTLGGAAEGNSGQVAKSSRLKPFPPGPIMDIDAVRAILDRLDDVVAGLRKGILALDGVEPVTQDLLIGISAELEKSAWMLRAQFGKA